MVVPSIPLYKVMLLGDGNVGKTSLARRFCEGKFEESRVLTIGVDFQTKIINLADHSVKLSIWDVAGQPRFQVVRESFYRGCRAAVLVFDLFEAESLRNLVKWVKESTQFAPGIKFLVAGNKLDLQMENRVAEGKQFAEFVKTSYIETSAKTGEGVEMMFTRLAELAE